MRRLLLTIAATLLVASPAVWAQLTVDNTIYYNGLYYIPHADQGMTAHVAAPTTGNYGGCYDSDDCWGDYTKPTGAVNIPMTIEFLDFTYTVTEIDPGAFRGCTGITSVHLPSSITKIEEGAFSGCTALASVNIPSSVTYIGDGAFTNCSSLYSVTIPSNFTGYIDRLAFANGVQYVIYTGDGEYSWMNEIRYNGTMLCRAIENGLYYSDLAKTTLIGGDLSLTSVVVPPNVTSIAANAFLGHPGITSVSIPHTVADIGKSAFACPNLTTVDYNYNYTGYIYENYFLSFDHFNIVNVSQNMFRSSTITAPITQFNIGDSVRQIPPALLLGCPITSLTVPERVQAVGGGAFFSPTLTSVQWNAGNCTNASSQPFTCRIAAYDAAGNCVIDTLYNPYGGYSINQHYDTLTAPIATITIGAGVRRIPDRVFRDLPTLTSLTLGDSLKYIGQSAFEGDTGLTSIALSPSLDTVAPRAFAGTSLTTLTIPQGISALGQGAFACANLSTLAYNARRANCYSSEHSWSTDINAFGYGYSTEAPISSLAIGDSVESIPTSFLPYDTLLTELTIPASVKRIGSEAFYKTRLTIVTIPEAMDTIEGSAFSNIKTLAEINFNATGMTSADAAFVQAQNYTYWDYECDCNREVEVAAAQQVLNIGANVRSIPNAIFAAMNITSVQLPDSLETIGQEAFAQCTDLQSVVVPASVQTVGRSAFAYCGGLTSVLFADDSTGNNTGATIAGNAFSHNDSLTNVVIGNTVSSIDAECFQYSPLQRVVIGPNVTSIGDKAFNGVTNIDTLFMQAEVPPAISANTFQSMPTNTRIMVPCGTKEDYEDAPYWNIFTRIGEAPSCYMLITATGNDANMGSVTGGGRYSLGNIATLTAAPRMGHGFSGWADGSTDNPRLVFVNGNASYTANFASMSSATATDTVTMHDTTIVVDTIQQTDTLWQIQYDTAYVTLTDTLTEVHFDTVVNTIYDTVVNTVYDTVDNYIHDTTVVESVDTLWLTDTIYLTQYVHDTVYIHDTVYVSQQGIEDVGAAGVKMYQRDGRLVVESSDGNSELPEVAVFDVCGRRLATNMPTPTATMQVDVPVSGAYLVKVGHAPARRVVVVK